MIMIIYLDSVDDRMNLRESSYAVNLGLEVNAVEEETNCTSALINTTPAHLKPNGLFKEGCMYLRTLCHKADVTWPALWTSKD